ncbi:hypothetical protein L1887_06017 [Cichorium endivia]|nr:hypothetical protein L1887_06017 [Cichorium endivia]
MQKPKVNNYSPTGVFEDYLKSLESETVSSNESTSGSEDHQNDLKSSTATSKWNDFVRLVKRKSKKCLATFHPISNGLQLSRKLSGSFREQVAIIPASPMADMNYFKPHWKNFTFSQLQSATNNFSIENMIGKGGYAEVYKGVLKDGQLVAVKQLTRGPIDERTSSFLSELGVMAHINHPNTAKLIGYGVEGGLHLVLELSPNGSLASWLHAFTDKLDWEIRYLAPEYLMQGVVDEKVDVFAFGVFLLELVSGRRALDYSQQSLVIWAKPLLMNNNVWELVDPAISDSCDKRQLHLMALAASLCIQQISICRPNMNQACLLLVLQLLKGEQGGWEFAMTKL